MRLKALSAFCLMLLFYALAVGAIAGLLWGGTALGGFTMSLHGRSALMSGLLVLLLYIAAGVIAYSLMPRFDRFKPPGPELEKKTHPALFREIARIAAATGEAVPAHIYLTGEVNAFVTQSGGLFGLFGRRMMGIGLPVLSALNLAELRAVLGHEFGHFSGGDTRLNSWVYRARRGMVEMVQNLDSAAHVSESQSVALFFTAIGAPFHAFAVRYIRFTQGLSRVQELAADQVGASVAGSAASIAALQRVRVAASTFQHYLDRDVTPVVRSGHLPPVADGFRRFLADESIEKLGALLVGEALDDRETSPYDSHPPLSERVAALKAAPRKGWGEPAATSALELLGDVAGCEQQLMAFMLSERLTLKRIQWAEAGRLVAGLWRAQAVKVAAALGLKSFHDVPVAPGALRNLVEGIAGQRVPRPTDAQIRRQAEVMLDVLVFAALSAIGFTPVLQPARPLKFTRGEESLEPEARVAALLTGTAAARSEWADFCVSTGLADFDLSLLGH